VDEVAFAGATANNESKILVFDTKDLSSGIIEHEPASCASNVHALCTDCANQLYSGSFDGDICVWNIVDRVKLHCTGHFAGHTFCVNELVYIDELQAVVAASEDETVQMWSTMPLASDSIAQGAKHEILHKTLLPPTYFAGTKTALALDQENQLLFAGSENGELVCFGMSGQQLQIFARLEDGAQQRVASLTVREDKLFVATGNAIRVHTIRAGAARELLKAGSIHCAPHSLSSECDPLPIWTSIYSHYRVGSLLVTKSHSIFFCGSSAAESAIQCCFPGIPAGRAGAGVGRQHCRLATAATGAAAAVEGTSTAGARARGATAAPAGRDEKKYRTTK
jgi:hypothetical protein